MKRNFLITTILTFAAIGLQAGTFRNDMNSQIPEITISNKAENYQKVENVAQYANADWSQAIGIARGISLNEAYAIADSNPEITYFFYTKGGQMVLLVGSENYRLFQQGDVVFFSGKPWWGSATDLADGYIKLK